MRRLLARHDPAAQARYQALKELARGQRRILSGTPGTIKRRVRGATAYWVREYIRPDGRKDDEHLGTPSTMTDAALESAREEVELARSLAAASSALRLFGYQRVDRKVAAVMTALFNRGLFEAGLVLVGSHAYGSLLNDLGAIAPGYRTHDLDLARASRLSLAPGRRADLETILAESGLAFTPVPGMPSRRPSTSLKMKGPEGLSVDLLVPGATVGDIAPAAELGWHAQTVPLLDFLVAQPVDALVLSPNQVVPVRVPAPERFAAQKLFASQSRAAQRDKVRKDLEQAAVLGEVLEEETPGRLSEAFKDLPSSARAAARRGALAASRIEGLTDTATETFRRLASR